MTPMVFTAIIRPMTEPAHTSERPVHIVPPCLEELRELYRDDHLVMVDKPAGLLSVPGRHADNHDSALSRLQAIEPESRAVHRLDMSTSGVMVFALNAESHRHLSRQFQDRLVTKAIPPKCGACLKHRPVRLICLCAVTGLIVHGKWLIIFRESQL